MAVCAGLLIGDIGAKHGMSAETRDYVDAFWKLIDEILNAVLFLMIGFEVIVAFAGFLLWFYLVAKYSASGVASFSFLSPVFAVFMGWGILGERIGVGTWGALILVSLGLILINRKRA